MKDVTRRFTNSVSMEEIATPNGFNFQGLPYGVQQELGNHLVFQALQQQHQQHQPLYANGATPPMMAVRPEPLSPSVPSGTIGYDAFGQQPRHSLSEDVDLTHLNGSTSYVSLPERLDID